MLAFSSELKNKQALSNAIISVASRLGIKSEWLATVIYNESRFNYLAKNSITNAFGLIQFMPDTLKGLGYTIGQLEAMTEAQQMEVVYKYFLPYKNRMKTIYDVYSVVFFPASLGKPDDYVFETSRLSASLVASQNHIFDLDSNKSITMKEFKEYIKTKMIPSKYLSFIDFGNPLISVGLSVVLLCCFSFLYYGKI